MPREVFDHNQLLSIKRAADLVAEGLGAARDKDKRIVSRAVFDIAAEKDVFDTDSLVAIARERLTPNRGWSF